MRTSTSLLKDCSKPPKVNKWKQDDIFGANNISRGQFERYIDNSNILEPSNERAFIMVNEETPDITRTND